MAASLASLASQTFVLRTHQAVNGATRMPACRPAGLPAWSRATASLWFRGNPGCNVPLSTYTVNPFLLTRLITTFLWLPVRMELHVIGNKEDYDNYEGIKTTSAES
jgi:hypothetical protein